MTMTTNQMTALLFESGRDTDYVNRTIVNSAHIPTLIWNGQKKRTTYDGIFQPGARFFVAYRDSRKGWDEVKEAMYVRTLTPRNWLFGTKPTYELRTFETRVTRDINAMLTNLSMSYSYINKEILVVTVFNVSGWCPKRSPFSNITEGVCLLHYVNPEVE